MRDAQNEEALVRPDIDDPVVADPQTPQPLEFTSKRLAPLSASGEFGFQPLNDSPDFSFVDAS
jgi:hypothetical protein